MRITPNNGAPELSGVASSTARRPVRLEQDNLTLTAADTLSQALEATPAVRAEKVEQAKKLVLDASYPPDVLINKISALFAGHLGPKALGDHQDPSQPTEVSQ